MPQNTGQVLYTGDFMNDQLPMFDKPIDSWNQDIAKGALDELFAAARQYKSGKEYWDLLQFISRFHSYSIFNNVLVHIQMPGARYIASASRWMHDYKRRIRLGARPLVIMKPMGPVMFVFDVSDTEPEDGAPPLPDEVLAPFAIKHGYIQNELENTIKNAKRDGIEVTTQGAGSQSAGSIQTLKPGQNIKFQIRETPQPEYETLPLRYGVLLNGKHSPETQYATLVHELAHLYCGHLGTPNTKHWPDRRGLPVTACELEAESVCYLVCQRLRIENPSEKYLSGYVKEEKPIDSISLDLIIKAATLIEQMGGGKLPPRRAA